MQSTAPELKAVDARYRKALTAYEKAAAELELVARERETAHIVHERMQSKMARELMGLSAEQYAALTQRIESQRAEEASAVEAGAVKKRGRA